MSIFSSSWRALSWAFDPVQAMFNGNYWDMFVETFGDLRDESVLDLGCGTGEVLRYIHPRKYVGVDSNRSYVDFATGHFVTPGKSFVVADVTTYKPLKFFSVVLLSNIAHHLSDDQLLNLLRRLKLSRAKRIIIVDGYPKQPFTGLLRWLDDVLAGGRYFRTSKELVSLVSGFRSLKHGEFYSHGSFYTYPYVVLKL